MKTLINLFLLFVIANFTGTAAANETPGPGVPVPVTPTGDGSAVPQACTGTLLIDQAPDQFNVFTSDDNCDLGCAPPSTQQSIANIVVLESDSRLTELAIWGGYFPNSVTSSDNFTVIIHSNDAGTNLPDTVISTQSAVASARVTTGNSINVFGDLIAEHRWVLTLNQPVSLVAGAYWLEIFNSTPGSDDFVWESSDAMSTFSSPIAFDPMAAPGQNWNGFGPNRALQVCAASQFVPVAVPVMSKVSVLLLLSTLIFAGFVVLRARSQ